MGDLRNVFSKDDQPLLVGDQGRLVGVVVCANQEEKPMKRGVRLIAEERLRQIEVEGWTPEHDDQHRHGELVVAAARLALDGTDARVDDPYGEFDGWTQELAEKHRGDPIRQLVIAGALIAAEIDRMLRQEARATARETD